ncbi:hypothetical protein GCM10009850_034280 [Nonomuraea monospora]|uniref:Uncharacterized protein n=1 Tax=Nonomuraea monospora TaxID=568818 RepID=A0ABN3CF08_9ACTN
MHLGHVGQPSPEAVTRTPAPVTVMPALTTTEANAQTRIERVVGAQKDRMKRARRWGLSVGSFTSSMVGAPLAGPAIGLVGAADFSSIQGM